MFAEAHFVPYDMIYFGESSMVAENNEYCFVVG
jgi:hypothetical protein